MKRLENIDEKIAHPDETATDAERADMPTIRQRLRHIAMGSRPVGPTAMEDADQLMQCSLKLRQMESVIDLEDAEFATLNRYASTNPLGWSACIFKAVMDSLREAATRKQQAVTLREIKGGL